MQKKFKAESKMKRGRLDILVDIDPKTCERRVAVYSGETMLATIYVPTLAMEVERAIELAKIRRPHFIGTR